MSAWKRVFNIVSSRGVRLFFWLAGAMFFIGLFAKLTEDVFDHDDVEKLDKAILFFAEKVRVRSLNGVAVDLTALGSPTIIGIVTVIGIVVLWLKRDHRGIAYLAICAMGAGILTWIVKHVVGRARPEIIPRLVEVTGQSYPSGHSLSATAVYLGLSLLACQYFVSFYGRLVILSVAVF